MWTIKVTRPDGSKCHWPTDYKTLKSAMEDAKKWQNLMGQKGFKHEVINRQTKKVYAVE